MIHLKNYIDGKLIAPTEGNYLDNINPATAQVYSKIPESTNKDLELAIAAAEKAFPAWSLMPIEKRSKILHKLADRRCSLVAANGNGPRHKTLYKHKTTPTQLTQH